MVEPVDEDAGERCFTGIVLAPDDQRVMIDIGPGGVKLVEGARVVVSVFRPDALYRLRGELRTKRGTVVLLDPLLDVERVQRRRSPRHALRVSVTLVSSEESDPDVSRVAGRSLDIGAGGLRVETIHALPAAAEPIAIVSVPHGAPLMLPTRIISAHVDEDGCEYRLAFTQVRPTDAERLAVLIGTAGSNATA
jgi:c-di-GMP-binding flagellar brake protein YcgR